MTDDAKAYTWIAMAVIGAISMIWLTLRWSRELNTDWTLMDLAASVIIGGMFGPLIFIGWLLHQVKLRKKKDD